MVRPSPPLVVSLLVAVVAAGLLAPPSGAVTDDPEAPQGPRREHPAHGTRFWFEVVESFNAKYEGDTPGHVGRGGGLVLHPHVALGDPVYHFIGDADRVIGVVTGVTWDRLRGSLTIEFRPKDDHRISVGDEVWVDLNPTVSPQVAGASGQGNRRISIPFRLSATGSPIVAVRCRGRDIRLVVDTAAEASVLTPAVAEALGIDARKSDDKAAGLGTRSPPVARLGAVRMSAGGGEFSVDDLVAVDLSDVQTAGGEEGIDGLLGSPFFRDHDAQIDYEAGAVRMVPLHRAAEGAVERPVPKDARAP